MTERRRHTKPPRMRLLLALTVALLAPALRQSDMVAAAAEEQAPELYHTPAERRDIADLTLNGMSIGALLEVEASAGSDMDDDMSDVVLARFALGVDGELSKSVTAHALFLWEEDNTEPVDLDEASITVNTPWLVSLSVGRQYTPFGVYNSHFVSDPLVLELGETKGSSVILGAECEQLSAQVMVFNGQLDEGDDRVEDWVAALNWTPCEALQLGAYWTSDLGESDGLFAALEEALSAEMPPTYDEVPGAGGFVCIQTPWLALDVEYIAAAESFDTGLLRESEQKPIAWNAELAWTPGGALELAVKVEGSDEFPGMPTEQMGAALSVGISDGVSTTVEYLHGEYDADVGDRHLVTAQLAVEF